MMRLLWNVTDTAWTQHGVAAALPSSAGHPDDAKDGETAGEGLVPPDPLITFCAQHIVQGDPKYVETPPATLLACVRENNMFAGFQDEFIEPGGPHGDPITFHFTMKDAMVHWSNYRQLARVEYQQEVASVKQSDLKHGLERILRTTCHALKRIPKTDLIKSSVFMGFQLRATAKSYDKVLQ
ncbi:hypothetical protein WJX72_002026 [[Myrmecia] bisecta]|uniref:Uncharacterized protein n=1 Tax=[Myrmecia] bisecta TaxID=41462 RepID=A0AAW1PBR9_9CHLO